MCEEDDKILCLENRSLARIRTGYLTNASQLHLNQLLNE